MTMPRTLLAVVLIAFCVCVATASASRSGRHQQHRRRHQDHARTVADVSSYQRQELGGTQWSVTNKNGSVTSAATVPGNVYTDLMAAGVLQGDPLYRANEAAWQWVAYDEWTYTTTFDLAPGLADFTSIQLQCDGLDTVAAITLNNQPIGNTNNMHLCFIFEVGYILKATGNVLAIRLSSPIQEALEAAEAYPYTVPADDGPRYLPNRNFLRKAQSDSGWDWGPSFAPSGIWQPICLVGSSSSRLMSMVVQQQFASGATKEQARRLGLADGDVLLRITSHLRVVSGSPAGTICASIVVASGTISQCTPQTFQSTGDLLGEHSTEVLLTVRAPDVQLWWPNGYGAQPLFPVEVTFTDAAGIATDSLTRRIGFKTVELVRETGPEGQLGVSFYFKVNGLPIFAKGANMIPADVFHSRVKDFDIELVLSSLLEAGGNVVRVWGGGIYQRDALYEYASQHGLLVWQEFAFACAMYPRDDAFLALVRQEVSFQTRRLSSFAAMLLFGGNNENEAALTWQELTRDHRDIYLVDYAKLYIDTVRDQLRAEIGGSLPFVTSSPSRGPQSEQPYTQLWGMAQSSDFGDTHYYNYQDDCSDVSLLPRARFVSEFGHQSLPSLYSWAGVTEAEDWAWNSTMMAYRQRHPDGNEQMVAQMSRHFQLPNATDPVQQFDDWLYATQAVQALCYRTALEHWRRIKQETVNGSGRTMGVLYWQLNDIWQGPTWSSIEHSGRWKMLHYFVKRAFAPLLASGYYDATAKQVHVYATSDVPTAISGLLTLTISSWQRGLLSTSSQPFDLATLASSREWSIDPVAAFKSAGCLSTAECYLTVTAASKDGTIVSPQSEIFVTPLRDSPLQAATLLLGNFTAGLAATCGSDVSALTCASFTLSSTEAAAYVFVESSLFGRFDDNGFVLGRGEQRTLTFTAFDPAQPFALQDLQSSTKARSIRSIFNSQEQADLVR